MHVSTCLFAIGSAHVHEPANTCFQVPRHHQTCRTFFSARARAIGAMGAGALFGFVELDALQAVTFLGPCHAARLASSCSALSLALSFPCLRTGAAALATSSSSSPALGGAGKILLKRFRLQSA